MDYSHFSILLLLVSLALLVAEVFLPSGGFIAVMMLLSLTGSVICAYHAWWDAYPIIFWSYIATVLTLIPVVFVAAFAVFPRTPFGKRILLEAPTPEEVAPYARERQELNALVGERAKTITPHAPAGLILVNGRRLQSIARGLMLDANQDVEIVGVKGNTVVVRLADSPPPSETVEETTADFDDSAINDLSDIGSTDAVEGEGSQIDFDLPEQS
ncbi:NfeD family protein [Calycomorphotria hydatis]|uniref:NfeD-like C-terminal domain-containing protein n=1 Tax=Calycomorphotria hydatis TaxID=2528027 RepID=A0A517TBF5_9PLAN|nr:NfeD family protein [Calycomorphotria hydatis]QDT65697.1 hypothetical protein V22_29570 [Calycomorphotria hydatis]